MEHLDAASPEQPQSARGPAVSLQSMSPPSKPPGSTRIASKVPESIGRLSARLRDSERAPEPPAVPALPPPVPFWFGLTTRPLFGSYHAPVRPSKTAILLCNTIGHEALTLHRTYRRLAQHLAQRGFATLRFDYDGTGDSAGSDEDPGRRDAWLASIQQAVAELERLSGCQNVILIGTRIGSLLAMTFAQQRPVAGLVMIAPPRSGRAWLREVRSMQAIKDSKLIRPEGAEPEVGLAGFLLSETTRTELSALTLNKTGLAPATRALVIARDDLPSGEDDLVRTLSDLQVTAELSVAPGYAAAMPDDPFKAVVPTQMFDAIGAWLDRSFPAALPDDGTPPPNLPVPRATTALTSATTQERIADVDGLFGITTEAVDPNRRSQIGIVLLNIGANYHIGSNRMYVHMARALAEQGVQVLRMDFSGMGESRLTGAGKENDVYASRFMSEARSGVGFLSERGAQRIILMGLCSGAYVAYHTATADPRVSGVVLVNPLTFHWTEGDSLEVRMRKSFGSTEQYKRRLFQYDTWRRLLQGKIGVVAISSELARRVRSRAAFKARWLAAKLSGGIAEATDIERGFRQMCQRGTSSLLILGFEDGSRDAVEAHLGKDAAAIRTESGFRMEIWTGTDHTFTPLTAQQKLISRITRFVQMVGNSGGPP